MTALHPSVLQRAARSRLVWPLLALAVLLLFDFFFLPGFFQIQVRDEKIVGSLVDILNRGTLVGLTALGMTLVIATSGIDLSVGAIMAIAGAIAASLLARPEGSPLAFINAHGSITLTIVIALFITLLLGIWNGLLVAALGIQPIVATLILMVAGRGVAQLLTSGQIITFQNPTFGFLGNGILFGLPFPIFILIIAALILSALTRLTGLGLFIEAVGDNAGASRLAGIHAGRVKVMVYTICALCAGVAGLITTADISAADANNSGLYFELDAILAVAIGGTSLAGGRFSLVGSLLGTLVIQTLSTTIQTKGIDPAITQIIKAALVVAVCLLQSEKLRAKFQRPASRSLA